MYEQIIEAAFSSWWPKLAAAVPIAAAVAIAFLKIYNGLHQIVKAHKVRKIERRIAQEAGVTAFTRHEIENACRNYVEPNCTSTDPSDEDDLRNVVALAPLFRTVDEHFARGGERRHLILLADSGMGKTSFCINYFAREQKKNQKIRNRIAIIPLGSTDPLSQIQKLDKESETIIFLDAFDEDPHAISNPNDRLRQLMSAASRFKNIVITCRSQFFEDDDSIPRGSGIMYLAPRKAGVSREFPLHKLFLAPFNEGQVAKYLAKNFPYSHPANIRRRRQAARLVESIPELSVRPMLLELVPDLIREKKKIYQLFELYEYLIESWLKRERDWINEDKLRDISIELAVVIFARQRAGAGDRISASNLDGIAERFDSNLASWKLKSRSLLNRDIMGNYKFAHRSIMEFLVVLAALRGDQRALDVEWTDLMKDLLVSLANTNSESEERTVEFLKNDLSATGVLPLATSLDGPKRLSLAECKRILRNRNVSVRHSRSIPVAWRNMHYKIRELARSSGVVTYLINDQTDGLLWVVNDASGATDLSERELYVDRFKDGENVGDAMCNILGLGGPMIYRNPSIQELITLWECEPFLCNRYSINHVLDPNGIYWVGDSIEDHHICASFGADAYLQPNLKPIDMRLDTIGRKLWLYELVARYGMVLGKPYRAFSVRIVEGAPVEAKQGHSVS